MKDYAHHVSHLTSEQLAELMAAYYGGERPGVLIARYNLDLTASNLYRAFPHEPLPTPCPNCGGTVYQRPANSRGNRDPSYCTGCEHRDQDCRCAACKAERTQKQQVVVDRQRAIFQQWYDGLRKQAMHVDDIDSTSRVWLATLLRGCSSQEPLTIAPLKSTRRLVAPSTKMLEDAAVDLLHKRILLISPRSRLDSLVFQDDGRFTFFPDRVMWEVNLLGIDSDDRNLLLNPEVDVQGGRHVLRELWIDIAIEELVQYIGYRLQDVRLPFARDDKTTAHLESVLESYSEAQVTNFIWTAARDAAADVQARKITAADAGNGVPLAVRRKAERALANNWDVKPYRRDRRVPPSIVASVLYDVVLGLGDDAFEMCPWNWSP